jgi:hypothetical protein
MKNLMFSKAKMGLICGFCCLILVQSFAQQPIPPNPADPTPNPTNPNPVPAATPNPSTTVPDTVKPSMVYPNYPSSQTAPNIKDPIGKNGNPGSSTKRTAARDTIIPSDPMYRDKMRNRVSADTLMPNNIGQRPAAPGSENNLSANKRTSNGTANTYTGGSASALIQAWPEAAKTAADAMIAKYGQPLASTDDMLMWKNKGVWEKIVVTKDETQHDFPKTHMDVLEQTITYKVPVQLYDDLARFDGSVTVNRTKGTLSARCDKEAFNILALNLAHDIITGKRTAENARTFLAQTVAAYPGGANSNYTTALMFKPEDTKGGDPDKMSTGTPATKKSSAKGSNNAVAPSEKSTSVPNNTTKLAPVKNMSKQTPGTNTTKNPTTTTKPPVTTPKQKGSN